jgi:hypothetical protein
MTAPFAAPQRSWSALRHAWAGPWLIVVAALHTIYAAVAFAQPLQQIAARGVWDSIGHDPLLGAVAWFVLFGFVLALLGWAVLQLEGAGAQGASSLRPLGIGLLALALLGIALMPASGFWLALPAAFALCMRRARPPAGASRPAPARPHS